MHVSIIPFGRKPFRAAVPRKGAPYPAAESSRRALVT